LRLAGGHLARRLLGKLLLLLLAEVLVLGKRVVVLVASLSRKEVVSLG
jgi:hypothetical protein